MAKHIYSTYEAKAKLSEILRAVREGQTVTVAYRGEPIAEIRPIPGKAETFEERMRRLEKQGVLSRAPRRVGGLRPIAHRPGALARFLAERREE